MNNHLNYNFYINQLGAMKLGLLEKKIDIKDVAILNYLYTWFSKGGMKTIPHNGNQYFWVHYEALLERNPFLDIKKRNLQTRIKKMVDAGLLVHHPESRSHKLPAAYYTFGPSYNTMVSDKIENPHSDSPPGGMQYSAQVTQKNAQGGMQNYALGYAENCTHNIVLKHSNTKENINPPQLSHDNYSPKGENTFSSLKNLKTAEKKEKEPHLNEFEAVWLNFYKARNEGRNPPPPSSQKSFQNDLRSLYDYFLAEYGKGNHIHAIEAWKRFFSTWHKLSDFWQPFISIEKIRKNLGSLLNEMDKGKKPPQLIMTATGFKTASEIIRERYEKEQADRKAALDREEEEEEDY